MITNTARRSSNIQSVDYDVANSTLTVTFKSGGTYRYRNVSPAHYHQFMAAKSLGKAFNQMFYKNKAHPSQKLAPTLEERQGRAIEKAKRASQKP